MKLKYGPFSNTASAAGLFGELSRKGNIFATFVIFNYNICILIHEMVNNQ